MKFVLLIAMLSTSAFANEFVVRIDSAKDYKNYSNEDLKRRVWDLEKAVMQLQQKVFNLETQKPQPAAATWVCKVSGMGESFSATGASKAVAEDAVMKKCKADPDTDEGFHCGKPTCSE